VAVWLPEADGPVNLADPTHQALVMMLGHQSQREVLRSRMRTTAAMCTQAREQGRHLGGRPPYGYRLVDAGLHPNQVHARWGRRLHRLDLDPVTAGHVRWMFAQRLAGASAAGIARALNERGVPPPSGHDPARNPHRTGAGWTLRTVAAILANPRYTGRQVWNRQRTDHHETVPGDKRTSEGPTRAWNAKSDWVISNELAHPALVSDADFLAAQDVTALSIPADQSVRRYRLTGLLVCATCGRRLEGHWVHGRAGYRCRHGHTSARPPGEQPRWVYWSEKRILEEVLQQLIRKEVVAPWADADDLTSHLRGRDAVIVCADAILNVEDPTEADDQPTEPEPASPGPIIEEPTTPAVPRGTIAAEDRSTPAPRDVIGEARIPQQRGQQKTPTTAIPERDDSGGG
jgi:hypothetical protein